MKEQKFYCKECEKKYFKWQGSCTDCGSWQSIIEGSFHNEIKKTNKNFNIQSLSSITPNNNFFRIETGILEWDRVFGGGIMADSVILLAGMPGIGKSTLLLTIADKIASQKKILYISSEESEEQIKIRANRIHMDHDDLIFLIHNQFLMVDLNLL